MKKIFIICCMLFLSCATFGQQIKTKDSEIDDLITLLRSSGYELFSFDVSEVPDEYYDITFIKKEFLAGTEIKSSNLTTVANKSFLTDFPKSQWQKALDEGTTVIDPGTKLIRQVEKFSIGFYPSENDSTKFMQINVPEFIMMPRITFKLRGLTMKGSDDLYFAYSTRPFKINKFKENEFIPLILLGSFWYDERSNIFRFCGERKINPDMSGEILKNIPHYYVIGVKFVKK